MDGGKYPGGNHGSSILTIVHRKSKTCTMENRARLFLYQFTLPEGAECESPPLVERCLFQEKFPLHAAVQHAELTLAEVPAECAPTGR